MITFPSHWHNVLAAILLSAGLILSPIVSDSYAKEQVILDTDMVETLDDGTAMVILATSPKVKLLGVTTVTGNTWSATGNAYGLRQLEAIGQADQVPIMTGSNLPLRPKRMEGMTAERQTYGAGKDIWTGAAQLKQPASWEQVYQEKYGLAPTHGISKTDGIDFLINQVHQHPGEITIVAIGPCTNIAKAIQRDPTFAPSVKQIIYMGGSFFQNGNVTPAAEFNFWFDPEAAKITLRAPFKEQIILGLDVCEKVDLTRTNYLRLLAATPNPILHDMLIKKYGANFDTVVAHYTPFIWDTLAVAVLLKPSLITREVTLPVDVNDQFGLSYGQSLAFYGAGPTGTQKARIILDIDKDGLWDWLCEQSKKTRIQ